MSKTAIEKKWGKAGLSKVVQAKLLLKNKNVGKIASQASKSKKGSPRGMVGKTKKGKSEMKRTWVSGFLTD
jgi:hypothetical protein